jgi:hypothetical protein
MGEGRSPVREIPRVGRSLVARLGHGANVTGRDRPHTALDNGFSCDYTKALQRICDRLGPGAVASFFWRCQRRLRTPV